MVTAMPHHAIDLDTLNALRARTGLAPLDALPPPTVGRWYCGRCDAPMAERVWACPACRAAEAEATRLEVVAAARDSIPAVFRSCAFGSPRVAACVSRDAVDAVRPWQGSLLLAGRAGAGKSTLAAALLLRAIDSGHPRASSCRWAGADDIARAHAEHPLGKGSAPLLVALERAHVAVVDDIGAEHATAANPALDALIHARFRDGRVTIATTGLARADIERRYGAGVLRRLTDLAKVITMTAPPKPPAGALF